MPADADSDADADAVTPSSNTRSYTLWSVPSSPGRAFFKYWSVQCRSLLFSTVSFQIACEREQSQTGYNFHHEYGVALFPPHPHIDLSDAVSRLYSPSLFYRCCLLKISSSPNIIRGLSHIFTITMMTMAVLCQDRDLTCPFPARVLTFEASCESPNISVGGYFRRGWEWDTCGNSWWFTGTGVKVPSWQCE